MSNATEVFEAQFDDAEDLQEIKEQFVYEYVVAKLDEEDDPIITAIEVISEMLDWDVEPSKEALEPWLEELADLVDWQRERTLARREANESVHTFHKLRGEGRTVLSAARSLKKDPAQMLALARDKTSYDESDQIRAMRTAQLEEHRMKAYRARQRIYNSIGSKIQKQLAERDFSDVPTDKLAQLMLKLAELSKEDEPTQMSIQLGTSKV